MATVLRFSLPWLVLLLVASALEALPLTPYGGADSLVRITQGVANGNCSLPAGNECASDVSSLPIANYSDAGHGPIIGGGSVDSGFLHGAISAVIGGSDTAENAAHLNVEARDQFTVDGALAGETISITAHLLAVGVVNITTSLGANLSTVGAYLGTGWDSTYGGVSAFKSSTSDSTGYVSSNATIPLSTEAIYTFDVVTGTAFQLSYGMQLSVRATYAGGVTDSDFLNTATLSFDLPTGYTISSANGFGVPEPATSAMLSVGLLGLLAAARRR